MTSAIILFAHGSRDPQWRLPMEAVALEISRRQPATAVRCAYLEMCSPSLPEAAQDLITRAGVSELKVVPLFLGVGKHARKDLPELMAQLRIDYPEVNFSLLPAVGEHPELISKMADIALD